VVLEARKRAPTPRPGKPTQVGVGAVAASRPARDSGLRTTSTRAIPGEDDESPTRVDGRPAPPSDEDRTDETLAAPPAASDEDTGRHVAAPPAPVRLPSSGPIILPRRRSASMRSHPAPPVRPRSLDDEDDAPSSPTTVMTAIELERTVPERLDEAVLAHLSRPRLEADSLDDGWGPPGTTIPPPLLGTMPGADDEGEGEGGGAIPMPSEHAAPLIVAPPSPPESTRGTPALPEATGVGLVRALEDATSRAVQLIHALERATDRDGVVTLMIEHLGESHRRAGFFLVRHATDGSKANELTVFKILPAPPFLPNSWLRLDRPSTLQDVVGTRLPYRGPMHDDASRSFLASVLGTCPSEILLVPVTVRERVVGVLFGEHRLRHTFDDQLALAGRAAGMALERILLAKRT
jgi:hypothetical protein